MPQAATQPISATTRYCAVFGHPIKHSASPAMQNAGITELELNWRYLAFDVHPDHLRAGIDGVRSMKFIGLNLTIPHKLLAMHMVDVLDDSARIWGAVNTIRFEAKSTSGEWMPLGQVPAEDAHEIRSHGFNTDADAIVQSVREDLGVEVKGARVVLLGAGGAGRVAALKLASEGVAKLFLINRTASKAQEVAGEIKTRFPEVDVLLEYPLDEVDLLLNSTSLGLKAEEPSPLDEGKFSLKQAHAVYDMVYRPAETKLLHDAKAAGCRTANGIGMLLYQGAAALEIWTGKPAPLATMRAALIANVYA